MYRREPPPSHVQLRHNVYCYKLLYVIMQHKLHCKVYERHRAWHLVSIPCGHLRHLTSSSSSLNPASLIPQNPDFCGPRYDFGVVVSTVRRCDGGDDGTNLLHCDGATVQYMRTALCCIAAII